MLRKQFLALRELPESDKHRQYVYVSVSEVVTNQVTGIGNASVQCCKALFDLWQCRGDPGQVGAFSFVEENAWHSPSKPLSILRRNVGIVLAFGHTRT
jgi:hypothetical protein